MTQRIGLKPLVKNCLLTPLSPHPGKLQDYLPCQLLGFDWLQSLGSKRAQSRHYFYISGPKGGTRAPKWPKGATMFLYSRPQSKYYFWSPWECVNFACRTPGARLHLLLPRGSGADLLVPICGVWGIFRPNLTQ